VTAQSEPVELAHLVPSNESDWFAINGMGVVNQIGIVPGGIDSETNGILLREDVHTLWDRKSHFSIVPKPTDLPAASRTDIEQQHSAYSPTLHIWFPIRDQELYAQFHNLRLRQMRGIHPEYLFARFAWDVFPMLETFLTARQTRYLLVQSEERWYTAVECADFCLGQGGQGRYQSPSKQSRSKSPKKRTRPEQEEISEKSMDSWVSGFDEYEDTEMEDDEAEEEWKPHIRYTTSEIYMENRLEEMSRKRRGEDGNSGEEEEFSRGRPRQCKNYSIPIVPGIS
jgi:hypothetical protein